MEALKMLEAYKKIVDVELEKYFNKNIKRAEEIDVVGSDAIKLIKKFTLSGGKRIRPAFVYYGFLGAGGEDRQAIVEASMSMELAHSFLLIHDDIIDRDAKRHGTETLHEKYKKIGKFFIKEQKEIEHFGNSMAMIAGDMAMFMANEIIFNSKFPSENILLALKKLQEVVFQTIPGEMIDVTMEFQGKATERKILKMHESKTARYTFEGPLHLGYIFAKKEQESQLKENLKKASAFALPLGKAFQLRDDVLGVFGDEKKLGKPVGSDIIEGKQTLLYIKALEKGTSVQKKELKKIIGNKDITKKEIEKFRDIIEKTGALDYSNKLSEKLIEDSLSALAKAKIKNQEAFNFFEGIANYIINRKK